MPATCPRHAAAFSEFCPGVLRIVGCNYMSLQRGEIRHSMNSSVRLTNGNSLPPTPKATEKPKSPPVASPPMNYPAKRWKAKKFQGYFSSAKSSTLPGISVDLIFNGHGPLQSPPQM